MEIFRLFGSVFIENEKANKSLKDTDQQAEKVGKTLQSTIKTASKWGQEMGKQLTTVGTNISKKAGVPLAALTALMGGLAKTTADYGDQVAKSAQEVGLTTTAYQELTYAMGQNNLSQEDSLRILGRLNQRVGLARSGNENYRKSLKKMGVDLEALDKGLVGTEEAFGHILEYLSEIPDSQLQAAYASDIFGTMLSRKMMPLIRSGSEGVAELRDRARELGIVLDEEFAERSEVFGDTMDDLKQTASGLTRAFGKELLAPFINLGKWVTDIVSGVTGWIEENPKLVRQIIIWGGAIAGVLGVLFTLGMTLTVTGKIIGALGTVMGILVSKPMLIIAAIGALYLAWENDWLNIRTTTEEVVDEILKLWDSLLEWWDQTKLKQWIMDTWEQVRDVWEDEDLTLGQKVLGSVSIVANKIVDLIPGLREIWNTWTDKDLNFGQKVLGTISIVAKTVSGLIESINAWWTRQVVKLARKTAELLGLDPDDAWFVQFAEDLNKIWQDEELTLKEKYIETLKLIPGVSVVIDFIEDVKKIWDEQDLGTLEKAVETLRLFLKDDSPIHEFLDDVQKVWQNTETGVWRKTIDTIYLTFKEIQTNLFEKFGEKVAEFFGIPSDHMRRLKEYEAYRQRMIDEATKDMNKLQKLWWRISGQEPEGLLDFKEWLKLQEPISGVIEDTSKLTEELSKLETQALIIAEVMKQGGTFEQAMAILGIAYWETRGHGGFTHTDPKTGEVIRGGAGEYGIGQVMPGTGKDVWTRLWKQPAETFDEAMLEDLDTNIAMMVSYFLDRYQAHGEDLRLAIEGYNRGTAIDGMQAYTVGVVEWMEGAEGQSLANILYDGMENALEAMVQAGYDMDGDVREMAAFLAQSIADYLVGQSPPPEGPLSDIDEGGQRVMEAWVEGAETGLKDGVPTLTKMLNGIKGLFGSIWDKVPEEIREPIESAMGYVGDLIGQAEEALWKLDDFQEQLDALLGGGSDPEGEAKGFMARLAAGLNEKLDLLDEPMERFTNAVYSAGQTMFEVVKAISSGNWADAFLSIIMETESFAKAMELLGAVLDPVIALFDAVLAPIINFLLKLWNGIIDALSKISIFGWKPFGGLADKKIKLIGEDDGSGGSGSSSTSGRQVSEITGPTRDLLTDLMAPLANFGQIVAPIQDIRNILYERLPNYDAFGMDFAGAGAIGGDIVFESGAIVISSSGTSATELSRDMLDAIEREMARRVNFGIRGRGGR